MPSNNSLLKSFETKQTRFRTSWLKNATRSVGITMQNALEEVAPNTVEIVSATNDIARSVIGTFKKGKNGMNQIDDANPYVRIGKTAIKNAMNSIKTGKFGDADYSSMLTGSSSDDSGFSFGDEDADYSGDAGSVSGFASLSDQINRQSIAQIKTAQANMDTMISINSARMFQTQQISAEILNHITNIENSLSSMVQFNNETMLKFVQASMGYYEKTGAAIAPDKKEVDLNNGDEEGKSRNSNVLKNYKGGLNFSKYKEYVKKNFVDKLNENTLGLAFDENTLELLAQDPIGMAAQIAASSLIDKFFGKQIKGVEDRLSSVIPNALMSISNLSDSDNPLLKFVGDIFGLRREKIKGSNTKDIKINKGPIPFDGETKHAITSIITHELRNQTGYLKVIADKVIGEDSESKMKGEREFFNEKTGRFEKNLDIDFNLAKTIEERISDAFNSTNFGADLMGFTSSIGNDKDREIMEKAVNDMYMEFLKSESNTLTLDEMMTIINKLKAPEDARELLKEKIKSMNELNKTNFMSVNTGALKANEAFNDVVKEIRENGSNYYLEESGFMGLDNKDLLKYLTSTLERGNSASINATIKAFNDQIYEYNKDKSDDAKKKYYRFGKDTDNPIEIIQDKDFFKQLQEDGKLSGFLKNFDSFTTQDFEELSKAKVEQLDEKYNEIVNKIKESTQFKELTDSVKNGAATISNNTQNAASDATEAAKKKAKEVGENLSDVTSYFTGGLNTRTGMISRFLFGDQHKGTNGLFDGIAKSFNDGLKEANPDINITDGKKAVAMGGVGALTGAALAHFGFLPAILAGTGPIGGAIAGLTLSIAGAGPMLKKALFGGDVEEFEDSKGNKYSHRKKGLVGQIGTKLEVNLINPVKTAAINAITITALNIENGVLTPVKYLTQFVAKSMGRAASRLYEGIGSLVKQISDPTSLINRLTSGLFSGATKLAGGVIGGGINLAANVGGTMLNLPGNIFGALLQGLDPELAAGFDRERAGFRSKKKAAKLVNANRKAHDKNAQIIAKYTHNQYSEDTTEAREYFKMIDPVNYEKFFGTDEHGNFKRKGQIVSVDEEKAMKKELLGKSGASIRGDVASFDASSQTAIYTARIVMMQEQLVRAILGEKVTISANNNAELSSANHDSQKTEGDKLRERTAAIKDKYWKKLEDIDTPEEEREKIKERLQQFDKENYDTKIKEAEFNYNQKYNQRMADEEFKRSQGEDSWFGERLIGRIKYDFANKRLDKAQERHTAELLGLRKPKNTGAGFANLRYGGRGEDDDFLKELEDLKREEEEKRQEQKNMIREARKNAYDQYKKDKESAVERGISIAELKEEKRRQEDEKWKKEMLESVKGIETEDKEHNDEWNGIFSKKGLLTAGLILATPLILKALPSIIGFITDAAPGIIEFAKNTGPYIMEAVQKAGDALSGILDGVGSIAKHLGHDVENSKDTDSTGIDNTTSRKVGNALNIARIAKHSAEYATKEVGTNKSLVGKLFSKTKTGKLVNANKGLNNAIGKGIEGAKYALNSLSSRGTLKNAATLADKGQELGMAGYKLMDTDPKAGQKMMQKAEKMLNKSIKLSDDAAKGGKILDKVLGYIDDFYKKLLELFKKKFGNTSAVSFKELGKDQLIKFCKNHPNKITNKISAYLSAKTGAATITAGTSEVIFTVAGGLNGITGAAKLFHVPSNRVDATMRIISSLYGAAANTTVGGVIDILMQLFYSATGIDLPYMAATVLYTGAMKLMGRDDKIEQLETSKKELDTEYDEYKNTQLGKAYKTQLKAGIIPEGTTFEEFVAGVEDGTYNATYDSKQDYITKNHGAFSDKLMHGIGKGIKGIGKAVTTTGSIIFGSVDTTYTDSNGNTYRKNSDGNYDIITPDGENVGSVPKDSIPKDATKSLKYTSGAKNLSILAKTSLAKGKAFLENIATNEKTKDNILGKTAQITLATADKAKNLWDKVTTGGINFIKKHTIDEYVIYRPIDSPLSYYKLNHKKNYDWYSANGDLIEEDAKTYDEMMTLFSSGLVTKDKSMEGVKTAIKTDASATFKNIGDKISDIWNKGTSTISDTVNKLKETKVGKAVTSAVSTVKNIVTGGKNEESEETTDATLSEGSSGGFGYGGRSGVMYSQNDPKWKNAKYGSDTTMGDSGCGPTAVAMAMSDVTGRKYNPMQMAGLAEATGDRDSTGTNWNFVNNAASLAGVPSTQVYNPSANYIGNELASGNELILSGRTGGYGMGTSAYTEAGHYIVGTDIDDNGIVTYKDPTNGGLGRIPLSYLSQETGSAWSLGGRGRRGRKVRYGGRGVVDVMEREDDAFEENMQKVRERRKAPNVNWLGAVHRAKQAIANAGCGYSKGGSAKVEIDGKTYTIRNDCSGMLSFAFFLCGLTNEAQIKGFTSATIGNGSFQTSFKTDYQDFFNKAEASSIEELRVGDILCYDGHVEVFAGITENNQMGVYNVGSDKSANNPGVTTSGHKFSQLKAIYRPLHAGDASSVASTVGNTDATISDKKGKKSNLDALGTITGLVSDYAGEFLNRILTNNNSGSWDEFNQLEREKYGIGQDEEEGVEYDENGNPIPSVSDTHIASSDSEHGGSVGTFGTNSTNLSSGQPATSAQASDIYNKLRSIGFTPVATAGIMGNWQEETSNNPDRFEADWTGMAKKRGGLEGIFASNESLNEYTTAVINNTDAIKDKQTALNKNYRATDGNLYPGIGLAQWTGNRGYQLINYAKERGTSWRDYDTQLDFFMNGPSELNSRKGLFDAMNNTETPREAAALFQEKFEVGTYHRSNREANADTIYNQFGGAGKGVSISNNRISTPRTVQPNKQRGYSINTSATGYYGPKYDKEVFGGKGKLNTTDDLIREVITIIKDIASIESGASNKLDMLSNIKGGGNNVVVAGGSGGDTFNLDTMGSHLGSQASSRNFQQAYKMATATVR